MEGCILDMIVLLVIQLVENLDDGGNKSRLGLKIKSGNIVGNLEYKYDIGDGTSGAQMKLWNHIRKWMSNI